MTIDTAGSAAAGSIRALIGELAQIEDALRRTDTFVSVDSQGVDPELNPQLLALFRREAEIVATLREYRGMSSGEPGAS